MATFRRLLGFLRPYRVGVSWSFLLAGLAMGTGVLIPYLVGRTVDEMASAWISWYYMSDQDYKKETEARKSRQTLTSSR